MKEETGTFESSPGNGSSSRVITFLVVTAAVVLSFMVIASGCWIAIQNKEVASLLGAAGAAGTLFVTIAGSTLLWMYNQKKQEIDDKKGFVR